MAEQQVERAVSEKPFVRRKLRRDEGESYPFGDNDRFAFNVIRRRAVGNNDHQICTFSFFDEHEQVVQADADLDGGTDAHFHVDDVIETHHNVVVPPVTLRSAP